MIDILRTLRDFLMEMLETFVVVGTIFIVVYLFIGQPNQVKGASMEPSFLSGDYIFTSKITYSVFREPKRGDVVVFHPPPPRNQDIEYIKRIIGLPGDTIEFKNCLPQKTECDVFVNGQLLHEDYISEKSMLVDGWYARENVLITVAPGDLFVLGDNRTHSSDSRDFGPIKKDSVIGQVFFRYFPLTKAGLIPATTQK